MNRQMRMRTRPETEMSKRLGLFNYSVLQWRSKVFLGGLVQKFDGGPLN